MLTSGERPYFLTDLGLGGEETHVLLSDGIPKEVRHELETVFFLISTPEVALTD